jgi:hypothetical protein
MERQDGDHQESAKQGIVDLATFHGSKGLEWDYTFLISLSDDSLPNRKSPIEIIGERRLFYVAVTRARQRIFLTYHGNERCLTRFVREIGYQLLTFHGLAKYALSEFEIEGAGMSLQGMLDCLDGDEWQQVRNIGILPWNDEELPPIHEQSLFPKGESWKMPSWTDPKDFEAFLRLWIKRCIMEIRGWSEPYKDPLREKMIFTIRIFQEDLETWSQWKDEFNQMVKHFFADTKRMPPAEFGDVQEWAEKYGLPWSQKEIVNVTSILAQLRGQLRPLRFEEYSLEEFTIGPVNCVVPSEYRTDVLRSWRKFVNNSLNWREILLDIWRLACLEQVAEGRTAGLYRAAAMVDHIQDCIPFLERLETIVREMLEDDDTVSSEITVNPIEYLGITIQNVLRL